MIVTIQVALIEKETLVIKMMQNDGRKTEERLPLHDMRKTVNNQERTPWESRDTHEEPIIMTNK